MQFSMNDQERRQSEYLKAIYDIRANKEFMENLSLHSSHLKKFRRPRRRKLNYRYVRLLGRKGHGTRE